MDVARIRNKDLKAWFPLMDGVEVQFSYLGQSEYEALREQSITRKYDPGTGKKTEELDNKKLLQLIGEKTIHDWEGITDGGEPFPCTKENIAYLVKECTELRVLLMSAPLSFEKMQAAEQAAIEKN